MGGGYALHASHTVCPVNLTVPIPDGVSFEEAAFCHLAATSLHAIRRVAPGFGEYLGVSGLGLVGQLAVAFGRLSGCHVVGLDRLPMRLDVARSMGADAVFNVAESDPVPEVLAFCGDCGLEAAIVAFGGDATEAIGQLYQMMREAPDTHRWGRIAVVGGAKATLNLAAGMGNVTILSSARPGPGYHDDAWEHGADYPPVFVRWTTQRNLRESLRAMAEGRIDVRPLITDIFPLDDAPTACEKLVTAPEETLGVILKPDE
jgi:threonine dehydrogenase-like Zn-dependent dehydrogenase